MAIRPDPTQLRILVDGRIQAWRESRARPTMIALEVLAHEMEAFLVANAAWWDRTEQARHGLFARAERAPEAGLVHDRFRIVAGYDAHTYYGRYLEREIYTSQNPVLQAKEAAAEANAQSIAPGNWGTYAVVGPTVARYRPIVNRTVRGVWTSPNATGFGVAR